MNVERFGEYIARNAALNVMHFTKKLTIAFSKVRKQDYRFWISTVRYAISTAPGFGLSVHVCPHEMHFRYHVFPRREYSRPPDRQSGHGCDGTSTATGFGSIFGFLSSFNRAIPGRLAALLRAESPRIVPRSQAFRQSSRRAGEPRHTPCMTRRTSGCFCALSPIS